MPDGTKPRPVERVAIIGAGTMGGGIAMSFANAGIPVTLIETGEEQLKRGMGIMQKNYEATAARGGIPADAPAKRMGLITGMVGLENVKDADLDHRSGVRNHGDQEGGVRRARRIRQARRGARLQHLLSQHRRDRRETKRPQDVLGMHFFSPANVMKLCEIVRAAKTAPDALVTAVTIASKIAKVPAVVGVCDGFVGNRMLAQRGKQAEKLLFEGALPQQVDAVVTKFGMPMGPFAMGDLAGLDIGWRSRKDRGIKSEIADALCEAGRFGQKTGKGYYKYEAGSRAAMPDPEVETLINETLQRLGRKRRVVSDEEILERMMYPMINEGARILEEKIAARPSDIDVIWLYGYGWPIYRGGPMYYADQRRPEAHRRPPVVLCQGDQRSLARAGAAAEAPRRRRQDLRLAGAAVEGGLMSFLDRVTPGAHSAPLPLAGRGRGWGCRSRLACLWLDPPPDPSPQGGRERRARHSPYDVIWQSPMTQPGEQFYPPGVHWDDPIPRGTLPGLLAQAARDYGARPGARIPRSPDHLHQARGAWSKSRRRRSLRAGYGKNSSVALFLGNTPDHPINFFGALKAGARVVHLSPLDGERALSHKLSDSGARVLVTSNLSALLPTALKFLAKGLLDRLIVCDDDRLGRGRHAADARCPTIPRDRHVPPFIDGAPKPAHGRRSSADDIALLQYTGGTTGLPKGAMLSHGNLTSAVSIYDVWGGPRAPRARRHRARDLRAAAVPYLRADGGPAALPCGAAT